MPVTLALTVFVTLVPGEVVTLSVFPSEFVTYSVLPSRNATWPEVGRLKPALEPDDPPARAEAAALPPAPVLDPRPRRAAKREARLAALELEELEELSPF